MNTIIVNNPAMDYFLAKFRDERSGTYECNFCVETLSIFLAGEVSRALAVNELSIKTPLGRKVCSVISEEVVLVPILRAGISMLGAFQRILPKSRTGFLWAHRDEHSAAKLDKYKFPAGMEGRTVIMLDTMLATGGTANLAARVVREYRPRQILCSTILAIPSGIEALSDDIDAVFTAGCTDVLDENSYVYPGVGDSGDRLYG